MSPRLESVRLAAVELSLCAKLLHIVPHARRWERTSESRRSWMLYRAGLDPSRKHEAWASFNVDEQSALIGSASVVAGRPVSFPRMPSSAEISDEAYALMEQGDYSAELVDGVSS